MVCMNSQIYKRIKKPQSGKEISLKKDPSLDHEHSFEGH